jgi:putative ABC transport system substrate-binding protein
LGITLLEANAEQSRDVREAVESLIGRGVQAMWLGGDVAARSAIDAYADVVNRAGIALFTNYSGYVKKGTLFDLGANYYEVGSKQGQLAADILDGKVDPATVPVVDFMPSRLMLNEKIRRGLKAPWQFTAEALKQSVLTIGAGKQ